MGKDIVGEPTDLVKIVHDRRLAFLVGEEQIVQKTEGECGLRSPGSRWVEARAKELDCVRWWPAEESEKRTENRG